MGIVGTDAPAKVGDGAISVAQLEMKGDPREEWANIFRETWRTQREYFYDPKMQGADWNAIYQKYLPLLAFVGHRADGILSLTWAGIDVGHHICGTRRNSGRKIRCRSVCSVRIWKSKTIITG